MEADPESAKTLAGSALPSASKSPAIHFWESHNAPCWVTRRSIEKVDPVPPVHVDGSAPAVSEHVGEVALSVAAKIAAIHSWEIQKPPC